MAPGVYVAAGIALSTNGAVTVRGYTGYVVLTISVATIKVQTYETSGERCCAAAQRMNAPATERERFEIQILHHR